MTIESGDVQIIRDFDDIPSGLAIQNPSDRSGFVRRSPFAAVIPLVYKDTVYDVLVVYSSRANAFGVREQAVLQELGKTTGLGINAVERKKTLLTDTVVEIEFEIADKDLFFAAVSDELECHVRTGGCRFTIRWLVPPILHRGRCISTTRTRPR